MAYIVAQTAFGLVGQHVINPVGFGMNAVVDSDFHTVASMEFISHLYVYRQKRMSLTNSVNYANIYVGFFFNRKKIYK